MANRWHESSIAGFRALAMTKARGIPKQHRNFAETEVRDASARRWHDLYWVRIQQVEPFPMPIDHFGKQRAQRLTAHCGIGRLQVNLPGLPSSYAEPSGH
jgi:hypothetical protein